MAKNYKRFGDTLNFIAAGALAGGAPHVENAAFGVIGSSVAAGEVATLNLRGVYELPAVSGDVMAVGAKLYWNGTALTTTVATNKPVGFAASNKAGGVTLVELNLIPGIA